MHNPNLIDHLLKPIAKLALALGVAWISAILTGFSTALIASWAMIIGNMVLKNSVSFGELVVIPPFGALYLTGAFGISIPLYVSFQIVFFGIPVVLIAWRSKQVSLKTLSIAGFMLAGFPWIYIANILVLMEGSMVVLQKLQIFGSIVGIGILLGLCGFITGACCWLALQFLRFDSHQDTKISETTPSIRGA